VNVVSLIVLKQTIKIVLRFAVTVPISVQCVRGLMLEGLNSEKTYMLCVPKSAAHVQKSVLNTLLIMRPVKSVPKPVEYALKPAQHLPKHKCQYGGLPESQLVASLIRVYNLERFGQEILFDEVFLTQFIFPLF
jgi:hypothetical protein